MTPSLLPRTWLFQGLIGGINAAIGYGIGVVLGTLVWRALFRRRDWWPPGPRVLYGLKAAVVVASVTASVLMVIPAAAWQRQVSALMGMEGPTTLQYMRTLLIAAVAGGTLVGVARVVLDAIKTLARFLIRRWHVHTEVALFIGTAIVAVLIITLVNGVLFRGFIGGSSALFRPQNASTPEGIVQPTQYERSGSPESFAHWETLGYQGRTFVATGPHADELTELNGRPAKEPIRIYAGLATADNDEQRTSVILSELQRTHAFERKILVIVPTTGTGWVDPLAARAIESMYNGDTALVAMQYSYLPSWISFLADRERSMASGKALIDAVQGRWAKQAPDKRPKLALYGESLGSMAGQAAFSFLPDIEQKGFSSVLWVGPPNASPLWHALTVRRDPGTPEVEPRYDGGRTARFSGGGDVASVAAPPWQGTRVLFVQHASDPIVWWSPDLIFDRPDWLREPAGHDRSPTMAWYPIVT
ncbi:MAG TPA: alpha/beta-hydrolase family protein, partial [Mycobacterium sp.]|nr:alpha/beta-hydrolase family protein [Mycobacterium sp.]